MAGVVEASVTDRPDMDEAVTVNEFPTWMPDGAVPNVMVCETSTTVKDTELLVTEPEDAVTDALPCATAVTVLPETVTAVPVRLNVGVMLNGFPY
jgi:hypothetical protein